MTHSQRSLLLRAMRDDRGGEVLEWALVAGLLLVATIVVVGSVGAKLLARWNGVNGAL